MKYVAYYRVSTKKQGYSGLGIEAQKAMVAGFLKPDDEVLDEFTEVESGRCKNRPILIKALLFAKHKNATLLIAKLDRLTRSVRFITELQESNVKFVACDCPEANETMVQLMVVMAEWEARQTSERTKAALAQAKLRGVKLGRPQNLRTTQADRQKAVKALQEKADNFAKSMMPIISDIQSGGIVSYRGIARELNRRDFKTSRKRQWTGTTVRNLLKRYEAIMNPEQSNSPNQPRAANPENLQGRYEALLQTESFRTFLNNKLAGNDGQNILVQPQVIKSFKIDLSPLPMLPNSNPLTIPPPQVITNTSLILPPPPLDDPPMLSSFPLPSLPNPNILPILPERNPIPENG